METLVDSIPGIVLWLSTDLIALGYYRAVARPWGRSLLADQRFGGVMLWAIGELVGPAAPAARRRCSGCGRTPREAARIDAELDRARARAPDGDG